MLEMSIFQLLWFIIIAVLIIGYFVLDGFDLGIGVLYPFVGKTEEDKATLRSAVGPVWDGNEVWLLTAGGALFAAFPGAYATSFSGFYLAVMLVLFGLIGRAVAIEFRSHDPQWKKVWDAVFFVGSLLPALLLGVALGNIIGGIGLNAHGDYIDGFFALLDPFSLVCGLLGLSTMIMLGASWITVKTPTDKALYSRAQGIRKGAMVAVAVLLIVAALLYWLVGGTVFDGSLTNILGIVFFVVCFLGLILSIPFASKGRDLASHIVLSLVCVGTVGMAASGIFPDIIPATDPTLSLTIAATSSSEYTLQAMTIITCIGLPLVLLYHVIVYYTFRGKIKTEDLHY